MNEELCHRNMAFSLYQADEMPLVQLGEPSVEALGDDLWRVRVPIANDRLTPTILAKAQRNNVVRPDLLRLEGAGSTIVAAGWVRDRFRAGATDLIDAAGSVADPRAQRPARPHDARDRVPRARRALADADLRQRQGRQAVDRDPAARDAAAGAGDAAGALSGADAQSIA